MLRTFLSRARQDLPVYISDVRAGFQEGGTRPFHIHATLFDGTVRVFPLMLPDASTKEEEAFLASYIHASIYNILSSLGAKKMDVYVDHADKQLLDLAESILSVFQLDLPKSQRSGYAKCLNVNDRILAALSNNASHFSIHILPVEKEPEETRAVAQPARKTVFADLPVIAQTRVLLGIDIGGTDIKLAVSINGELAFCKEFDWFPAGFGNAGRFIDPIVQLTRLMQAAASAKMVQKEDPSILQAMHHPVSIEEIIRCCEHAEKMLGADLCKFDAIGVSFPDVVIDNRIVGGETYKTRGLRDNPSLDYEAEFSQITNLYAHLTPFVANGENVLVTNDGHMAAFTVAVEKAYAGEDVSHGVFAHTLGTELGSGWVECNGRIPQIPLEVYNFIIDLGSSGQRCFEADDVRSVNNFNTQLPGTLQKYTSQYGVFRLAAKYLPSANPSIFRDSIDKGMLCLDGEKWSVPTAPKDMRKPYLEYFMKKAADGEPVCQRIFREIGEYLSVTWEETTYILQPEATERTLFGRLVKNARCFQLICEGAAKRTPALRQYAADGTLANTELMRQLDKHADYTVAQFAQAVGSIYYACLACLS